MSLSRLKAPTTVKRWYAIITTRTHCQLTAHPRRAVHEPPHSCSVAVSQTHCREITLHRARLHVRPVLGFLAELIGRGPVFVWRSLTSCTRLISTHTHTHTHTHSRAVIVQTRVLEVAPTDNFAVISPPAVREAHTTSLMFCCCFIFLFFSDFCQTNYLNMYDLNMYDLNMYDLREICRIGTTLAVSERSVVIFSIPQWTLPWRPILWTKSSSFLTL